MLKQFSKAVLERAVQAELNGHLGYERHDTAGDNSGNSCNGKSRKMLKGSSATSLSRFSPALISSVTDAVRDEVKA